MQQNPSNILKSMQNVFNKFKSIFQKKKKSVNKPYNWDDFDTNFYNRYW
jgi:hypothetical protein